MPFHFAVFKDYLCLLIPCALPQLLDPSACRKLDAPRREQILVAILKHQLTLVDTLEYL